jgi:hypothetical protein
MPSSAGIRCAEAPLKDRSATSAHFGSFGWAFAQAMNRTHKPLPVARLNDDSAVLLLNDACHLRCSWSNKDHWLSRRKHPIELAGHHQSLKLRRHRDKVHIAHGKQIAEG